VDISGIMMKPMWNFRVSDVAIVSDELFGLNNRTGSQGPLDSRSGSTVQVPLGRKSDYGINAWTGNTDSDGL
jgi:hypothetical protein